MGFVLRHLQEPEVCPHAHREQADVDVAERNHEEAEPRPAHVTAIETARAVVRFFSGRCR